MWFSYTHSYGVIAGCVAVPEGSTASGRANVSFLYYKMYTIELPLVNCKLCPSWTLAGGPWLSFRWLSPSCSSTTVTSTADQHDTLEYCEEMHFQLLPGDRSISSHGELMHLMRTVIKEEPRRNLRSPEKSEAGNSRKKDNLLWAIVSISNHSIEMYASKRK